MNPSEYASYDALGLAELVETAIGLIEELNPTLNAVIHKGYERAFASTGGVS